ncbi:Ldh family oxidoreductase [Leucobacter sp. GX24907]
MTTDATTRTPQDSAPQDLASQRPATEAPDRIPFEELAALLEQAFLDAGVTPESARLIGRNCAAVERDGTHSHGVFRMPGYLASVRSGWLDGTAVPVVDRVSPSFLRVDGANGFSQSAIDAAREDIAAAIDETGVALVAIRDAHHFSSLWPDVEPFARQGLVALTMVTGGDSIVIPQGASERIFGTNPMAFATPRAGTDPLVWDFATSTMSHGDLTITRNEGRELAPGMGIGRGGRATQDPAEVLDEGGLIAFGGHKGLLLSLTVELLASALTGAPFSTEADSGKPEGAHTSRVGQFLLVADPERGGNSEYGARVSGLIELLREAGMSRVPGEHRYALRAENDRLGIPVTQMMREFFASLQS